MGSTVLDQIVSGRAGETTMLQPDYFLITDEFGCEVVEKLRNCGELKGLKQVIMIIDHKAPTGSIRESEEQKEMIKFAKENDVHFIQGRGIGYQIMLDSIVKNGDIIVSCGIHNSIFGAADALGLGVSIDEMAAAIKTGRIDFKIPETVKVELSGNFRADTSSKDLILTLLKDFNNNGLTGKTIEFVGSGTKTLSQDAKTSICSMAGQTGAVTAFFPNEEAEVYAACYSYDLSDIVPMAALPGDLSHSIPASELRGTKIDAAFVGGCSGGRLEDLRAVAEVIEGKHVKLRLRFSIAPVSNEVYIKAMEEGIIEKLIDFGAQIFNPGCASCKSQNQGIVVKGESLLTTGCYNFPGCIGQKEANVYLASARLVAMAAISGNIE